MNFETLYGWVKGLPIVDWHNHLDVQMLAEDSPLGSLYEVWVKSDPYKHRAMRICGEPEELITGGGGSGVTGTTGVPPVADESEKWSAWMRTLPKLVGNPLFAWAKMEIEWLGLDPEPYLHGIGENISLASWTPSKMLKRFNVEYISPCVGVQESSLLGQRASCPLTDTLGQRASRPLSWTAPEVKEYPSARSSVSSHFSHTLAAGCFHSRNLPHVGQSSTLVFVTFRLADSLPQSKLDELAAFKAEWLKSHPEPWDDAVHREWESVSFPKIEEWLDAGHGSCILSDPALRKVVEDALEHFNAAESTPEATGAPSVGKDWDNGRPARCEEDTHLYVNGQDARCPSRRYRLHSYVVMPNHVHVLFELFDSADIQNILHSWKSFTAKKLNRLTGHIGKVWKEEYYDRLIRNGEHYDNTIRYIRKNGEVAKALAECNGQDARCPSVVPSLRMNAGDEVPEETLERFHAAGCRVVDISVDDVSALHSQFSILHSQLAFAAAHGWTMLLHLGALRGTSSRLRAVAGPAGGFAGMRAPIDPAAVAAFLDRLEASENIFSRRAAEPQRRGGSLDEKLCVSVPLREINTSLPRTILLSLNPEAHAQLAVLAGSFVEDGVPGKVQLGPAWWWCDHEEGIRDVLEKNAAYGVLSTFVGMTTDSRSLLSFVRHDYFRRVLCKWVADKVASGAFPDDESLLRPMLESVCYRNAHDMVCGRREHKERKDLAASV